MSLLDLIRRALTTTARDLSQAGAPAPAPLPQPAPPVRSRFNTCLDLVLGHEGGFSNDPKDRGGATNLGITRATLSAWRGRPVTEAEVRALGLGEAKAIYRARYWDVLRCDELPAGIDLMVFDFGVNAGPGAASRMLQRAVGTSPDGKVGPLTIKAAQAADRYAAIDRMAAIREAHYRSLDTFPRFGRGWLRRTAEIREAAKA